MLQHADVVSVRRLQLPEAILIDMRDLACLNGAEQLQQPSALLMPGFSTHFERLPKGRRGTVPLSGSNAIDQVWLQLASHSGRSIAAHADEADAAAH